MDEYLNSVRAENIRELTKKEKILRLNFKSWVICVMSGLIAQPHLGVYSLGLFCVMLLFFYIIEFFDDDIIDIFFSLLQIKSGVSKYYA